MEGQIFYIVAQKTTVNKAIYEKDADHHFTDDTGQYFPLEKEAKSLIYQTLPYTPEGIIPLFELMIGMDQVEVEDNKFSLGSTSKKKQFTNIKQLRKISDN